MYNRNEIFACVRPQIHINRRGKVYTPMHMRYHLVKFVQENFELVDFLVIRSDMLWMSQNVRPIDCPIVLVQNVHGRFLGTRTKKPVYIGTVPRIKLTVKKNETQEIMHSTPVRKLQGSQNHFQTLGKEYFRPLYTKIRLKAYIRITITR